MASKDLLSLCGRVGLIVAVFTFIAAIIAGPVLQKVWSPRLALMDHRDRPTPSRNSSDPQAEKQS